ncbi:MAG TPA: hypothetical protein VIC30_05435 [Orrella sp.]
MLETKIEKLTDAIERLIVALDSAPTTTQATPVEPAKDAAPEQTGDISKDDLQAWALTKVREDKSFKVLLMEQLSAKGAKTISQLPDNAAAQEVYVALGGEA